jgi:hypothetical protein
VAVIVPTTTSIMAAWLYNTALGRTTIDAGSWSFDTYAGVNSVTGGRVSTITRQVYSVLTKDGASYTVTSTGTGVTRTLTASGGTPFATTKIDASATNTTASFVQTPQGIYQITVRTSDTVVTISTPSTYANEAGVTFNVWKKLFGSTSPTVTAISPAYALYSHQSVQSSFAITAVHKLGSITFGTSNASTTLTVAYDGTTHNSHISTPLVTLHGNMAGLQGGTGSVPTEEYYHLTNAQYTIATNAATGSNAGYLTSADWTTFNAKVGTSTTDTLTNKRLNQRTYSTASTATLTPEIDTYDYFELTSQAAALNIANHSTSTPTAGAKLLIAITSDATPRAITYGTNYVAKAGVALPTTTTASKTTTMGFI